MISFGRRSTAGATRRDHQFKSGATGKKSQWMTNGEDPRFSPTIFLIEQPPYETVSAHFHHNNQFQVFVGGGGRIGARALGLVTVHYAGAYTAYGPLVAGPEGLQYFTVRTVHENGAQLVSRSQGQWPEGPRRHAIGKPVPVMDSSDLRALSAPEPTVLMPRADDGLAATSVALPPNHVLGPVQIGAGEGVFLQVLSGDLLVEGEQLGEWESLYLPEDDPFPTVIAGDRGAQVLTMVPPKRDPAYPPGP